MAPPSDPVEAFFAAVAAADAAPASIPEHEYLAAIAGRMRRLRARQRMTRRALAQLSGVSERYLARMEGGTGNASLLVLRAVAAALGVAPAALLADRAESETAIERLLARLDPAQQLEAHAVLARHFSAGPRCPPMR